MVKVIKSIIKKIVAAVWGNMRWWGTGYADSTLSGKMYQHYGFKSYPPEGTENVQIDYGNNVVSVAENDVITDLADVPLHNGNVVLYAASPGKVYLLMPELNVRLKNGASNNLLTINNDPLIAGVLVMSDVPVSVKKAGENVYYLVTEKFIIDFCLHTHLFPATGGAPTTTPLIGGLPATPTTLAGDLTKTLKGDAQL